MFIAHLPLSAFILFRKGKNDLNKLPRLHANIYLIGIIAAAGLFLQTPQAESAFIEQLAIDPVAISLANTVTASPPGISSIHYNPAGLSLMGDGNFISTGAIIPIIKKTSRFTADPNFEQFHDYQGNAIKDPLAGTEGTNTSGRMYLPVLDTNLDFLIAPVLGLSHRNPGSKWTFGYSAYVPFAVGINCGDGNDPSRYDGKAVYLQHLIYAGPAVSYRLHKTLSLGASFGLGQTAMGIDMNVRAPNEIVNITKVLGDTTQGMSNPIFNLMGIPMPLFGGGLGPYQDVGNLSFNIRDDFSPSFNLGTLWEPFEWISFGLSYQSPIKSHLSGKYSFKYSQEWQNMTYWMGQNALMQIISMVFDLPYQSVTEQTGTVTTDLELPQVVNFGIKLKPVKRLSLLADLHWANWSSVKQDNIVFDQKIQLLQMAKFMGYAGGAYNMVLQRDFKDTLNWGVGIEYQALDWLALRAGYENRTASTRDQFYDLLYCLPSLDSYGAGVGIKWNDINIDLALGYLVNKSYTISNNGSVNMNSTVLGAGLQNPYRGLNYEQETITYMGGLKVTTPLEMVTGMLYKSIAYVTPSRWSKVAPAKGSLKAAGTGMEKPVDSSSAIINNLRPEGKYYYIEDSE